MRDFYNHVSGQPYFYILINLFLVLAVSIIEGGVGYLLVLLVLIASVFQTFLIVFPGLLERLISIENMGDKSADYSKPIQQKIAMVLVFVPLISQLSLLLGIAWVAVCVVLSVGAIKTFISVLFHHEERQGSDIKMLEKYDPEVVVYVSGLGNVAYQINQWLPVMERLGRRGVVVLRERRIFKGMRKTTLPVYYARTQRDLETIYSISDSLKVVLYPANTMKNVQSFRHFKFKHFFINHGESDKAVNQSKLLMAYDKLLVGGPLAKRRLEEAGLPLREGQVEFVGRPQAEILLDVASEDNGKNIETILYAPTWEGFVENVNYSSVGSLGLSILESLSRSKSYRVLFKPHPYTGTRSKKTAEVLEKMRSLCSGNIELVDAMSPIHEAMNQSDLLITDVSSVLNEYLVTKKPIVLCDVKKLEDVEYNNEFPSSKAANLLHDGEDILSLLSDIASFDMLKEERSKVRVDSLSAFEEGAMRRFSKVIDKEF